jgi:hypothetical protein
MCPFSDIIDNTLCSGLSINFKNIGEFCESQIVSSDEVYLLFNNVIQRYRASHLLWSTPFSIDLKNKFYQFYIYKNLVITQGTNHIALFSTENGKLLWQRSRVGEESVVQSFDSVYALNNRLIFQLEGTSIDGAVDISQFIK